MTTNGSIYVPEVDGATLDTPDAGRSRIHVDLATGRLATKDSGGAVTVYGDAADLSAVAAQVATNVLDIASNAAAISAHIADTNNPHGVTRAQLGLEDGVIDGQFLEWDQDTTEYIKSPSISFDYADTYGIGNALVIVGNIVCGPSGSLRIRRVESPAPATIFGANNVFNSVGITSSRETLIVGRNNDIRPPPDNGDDLVCFGMSNTVSNGSNSNMVLVGRSNAVTGAAANTIIVGNGGSYSGTLTDAVIVGRPDGVQSSDVVIGRSTQGSSNSVAIGRSCKVLASGGTAVGRNANVAAGHSNSVAIGYDSLTTASNQVRLGSVSRPLDVSCSNKLSVDSNTSATSPSSGALLVGTTALSQVAIGGGNIIADNTIKSLLEVQTALMQASNRILHRASSTVGAYLLDIEGGSGDSSICQMRRNNANGGGVQLQANNGDVQLYFTSSNYTRRSYISSKANSNALYIGIGSSLDENLAGVYLDSNNYVSIRNRLITTGAGRVINYRSLAVDTVASATDHYIRLTGTAITLTLSASPVDGRAIKIANRDGGSNTVDGNGKNIEGSATDSLPSMATREYVFNATSDQWEIY